MELKRQIENLKSKTLKRIEDAAKKGDTKTILSTSRIVEETEKLIRRWEEIKSAYEDLDKRVSLNEISGDSFEKELPIINNDNELSPKKKGKVRRNAFVQELKQLAYL